MRSLLGIDRGRLLERELVALGALRELGDLAVAIEQQALGFSEPGFHFRQAVGDGLLQHAPCVLVLFQVRPHGHDVGLERGDAGVAAVDVDQLAGAVQFGLIEAGFRACAP